MADCELAVCRQLRRLAEKRRDGNKAENQSWGNSEEVMIGEVEKDEIGWKKEKSGFVLWSQEAERWGCRT